MNAYPPGNESEEPLLPHESTQRLIPNDTPFKKISNFKITLVLTVRTLLLAFAVLFVAALAGTFFFPYDTALPPPERHAKPRHTSWAIIDVGYDHMNLDDCYAEKERSPSGDIVANKQRFPSGMNYLTGQLHQLGL
ncbi:hypothetical protein H0H92_013972 [Tricholoma furcatifolium]|nr:hypothetical protein H0H92_013972 [Tricholoma furcatifolium]